MAPLLRRASKFLFAAADLVAPRFRGPRILIYHQVGTALGREMEVSRATFARQLDWIRAHTEIVDFDTALIRRGEPGARRMCTLTFDDGYADMYRAAFPLLAEHRIPFTLYLTTGPMESRTAMEPGAEPLTWEQAHTMMESGLMTAGAHTHTHPDLRTTGADEVADEMDTSNSLIEQRLGVRPRHFAYPKGYWSATGERAAAERYESAALGAGPPVTAATSPYRLTRLPVQRSDGLFFFKRKLGRGLRLEEWARRRVKGYRNPR